MLVLDLPGHGLSDRPDAGYEIEWYSRLVARWMEALELSQVDVVGHSLGGGIALMLLRLCRPRIRRLVLAAPGGLGTEITLALRFAWLPVIVERLGQPFMALGARLALGRWRFKMPRGHISELNAMNARRGTARAFARTVRGLVSWRGQRHSFFLHAHELGELPPIAVLWGDRDAVVPIAHGRALAQAVEGARFEAFIGRGHYLHRDDPPAFLQAVRGALDAALWPPMRLRVGPPTGALVVGAASDVAQPVAALVSSPARWRLRIGWPLRLERAGSPHIERAHRPDVERPDVEIR